MDRLLDLVSIHEDLDQGQARTDCEAFGGTIVQVTPPLVRSNRTAFETGGPDSHARIFQGSSRPRIGKEDGGSGRIRVGDRKRQVEKTLPFRNGGWAIASNTSGGHDGRRKNQDKFLRTRLHIPRASASPSARILTSSSRK